MAYERICIIDKTAYEYCSKCGHYNSEETWRNLYCSENCRNIWNIINKYNTKQWDISKAKNALEDCNLSSIDKSTGGIKKILDEILNSQDKEIEVISVENLEDVPAVESAEVVEESKIVEAIQEKTIEEIVTETAEEAEPAKIKYNSKKRRNN